MKKIFSILLLSLVLFSCSKDDDRNNTGPELAEKIVGTWQLHKVVENGENTELGICLSLSTVDFFEDGTAALTIVVPGEDDPLNYEDCETGTATMQWEYLGNNMFEFTRENEAPEINQVLFSENDSIFTTIVETDALITETSYLKID